MIWQAILAAVMPAIEKLLPDKAAQESAEAEIKAAILDNEDSIMKARASIITAEAGAGWLASNWRPLAMLNFLALLDAYWLGYAPAYLLNSPEVVASLFGLLKLGIGGYIIGRSGEKIVPHVARIIAGSREGPPTGK